MTPLRRFLATPALAVAALAFAAAVLLATVLAATFATAAQSEEGSGYTRYGDDLYTCCQTYYYKHKGKWRAQSYPVKMTKAQSPLLPSQLAPSKPGADNGRDKALTISDNVAEAGPSTSEEEDIQPDTDGLIAVQFDDSLESAGQTNSYLSPEGGEYVTYEEGSVVYYGPTDSYYVTNQAFTVYNPEGSYDNEIVYNPSLLASFDMGPTDYDNFTAHEEAHAYYGLDHFEGSPDPDAEDYNPAYNPAVELCHC